MTEQLAGGDLSRLRQLNALAVVHVLRGRPALTLTELSRDTGLSRPSTEDVVLQLQHQGWLEEVQPASGGMGRPARRYRFRSDAGWVLGIDIGGHTIRVLAADLDGEVRHTVRTPVAITAGRAERLAAVDAAVAECLAAAGLTGADIWAATVGTSGLVDAAGRVVLSVAFPEWTGVHLAQHVGRLVGGTVLVENDSRLAALAETWRGVARYAQHVVYLLAGLRTGTGLIIDGRLHRGFAQAAGEIGALPELGWIRAQEHLRSWTGAPAGTDPDDLAGYVFASAREGDRKAVAVVRRYAKELALGASALVLALDPQLVVLGGGFSRSADVLLDPLRREIEKRCVRIPEIVTSTLGDEAVALGAVKLSLEHLQEHLFDVRTGLAAPVRPAR
ncbi:ROK family transcriptional regulator [Catellatospora vulcania]|uniref:ROK family transcriptional regulator n=1 Tax=Catellatospora vulcania TaxID=1460450 RepID=UPI0012D3E8EE|nr:ROK family transcriptional regulator [Catellatospora vulcania]